MAISTQERTPEPASKTQHGVAGNARLTALTGGVLLMLLAVQGLTILRMGQLLWLHLFLGIALAVLVALKLSSAGYRMAGYYLRRPTYLQEGPPHTAMRVLAVPFVLTTIGIFASGGALLLVGPSIRQPMVLIHKVCFFAWIGFFVIHLLAHAQDLARVVRVELGGGAHAVLVRGRGARLGAIAGTLALGVIAAALLIPQFSAWTSHH
jgi:hypothetical protein